MLRPTSPAPPSGITRNRFFAIGCYEVGCQSERRQARTSPPFCLWPRWSSAVIQNNVPYILGGTLRPPICPIVDCDIAWVCRVSSRITRRLFLGRRLLVLGCWLLALVRQACTLANFVDQLIAILQAGIERQLRAPVSLAV